MKIKHIIFILLVSCIPLLSQSHQSSVFSGGGGYTTNVGYTNFGVLGQPFATATANVGHTNLEGFIYAQDFTPPVPESWVSDDYNSGTPDWQVTYFDDLDDAIAATQIAGTINITNYFYTGDVDFTNFTAIIGAQDFNLVGNITGGAVQTPSTGKLVLPAAQSVTRTYPLSDGTNDFTVEITPTNDPLGTPIGVSIQPSSSVPAGDGMLSLDLWDISGPANLDATIVFNMPDASIQGGLLPENVMIRYWNGSRYVGISTENIAIVDNGTFYEITVTNVNEF